MADDPRRDPRTRPSSGGRPAPEPHPAPDTLAPATLAPATLAPATLAPATLAVHAGRPPRHPGAPANVPPVLTSTFVAGGTSAYARSGNPTWSALEEVLAALEGPGCRSISFASGMAAISAVTDLVPVGGLVACPSVAYSGTRALMARLARTGRIRLIEAAPTDLAAAAGDAALVWVETPVNPTLDVIDIAEVAVAARASGCLVATDSTFATPLGQKPLDLGSDLVVHSATKYLAGHSDLLLGAVTLRDPGLEARLLETRLLGGGIPGPMEAWIALRGLRTFPLRFERACASAAALAARCAAHPAVGRVRHPSLPTDPGHPIASRQMRMSGAIVSLELTGGAAAADRVAAGTRLWLSATSLGAVESTLERRRRWPEESPLVPEGLLRLSVGIEDVDDLWDDLRQALDAG